MKTRVLLIDAFNLIRRIFEARPDDSQEIDEVIRSSARSVARALRQHVPSHVCVVFDSHETTWRHLLYDSYKLGRKPTPALLLDNLAMFESAFQELGLRSITTPSYEADDVIATIAFVVGHSDAEAIILSTDKSFLQLLSDHVMVFNHFEHKQITESEVRRKYEVEINQLTDYWAMAGDASNNIKGVPKVGKKTAASLLHRYGSLENILKDNQPESSAIRVQNNVDLVQRCKQLVTLKTDVELGINLKYLRLSR